MRLVADESCDFTVVRSLRAAGHEVLAVAESRPRLRDAEVLDLVAEEPSILLTEDKDFGRLVYAAHKEASAVVLIRFPASARSSLPGMVGELLEEKGEHLLGNFVVLQPGRVRIRRI